tara:strand:+ start:1532 stop:1789 length:258 start_codon:yes stop_codon:yes gene_type:complete
MFKFLHKLKTKRITELPSIKDIRESLAQSSMMKEHYEKNLSNLKNKSLAKHDQEFLKHETTVVKCIEYILANYKELQKKEGANDV